MRGFEYRRLGAAHRRIYDELLMGIEAYRTSFTFGSTAYEDINVAFQAVLRDNPQIFWLAGSSYAKVKKAAGIQREICFLPDVLGGLTATGIMRKQQELEAAVRRLTVPAANLRSDFEKALYVHDRLVEMTDYVQRAPFCYQSYGCLVERAAVCAGYAGAYQLVLNRLGIPCGTVSGFSKTRGKNAGGHAWNVVELGGEYYYVDVTWDDPAAEGGQGGSRLTHHYFGLSQEELLMTHEIKNETFIPPRTGRRYNYYEYFGLCVARYRFDTVSALAAKQLRQGDTFSIKFSSPYEERRAEQELVQGQRMFDIPGMSTRYGCFVSESGLILTVRKL